MGGAALLCSAPRAAVAQPGACPPVPAIVSDTTVFVACQLAEPAHLLQAVPIRMPAMLRSQGVAGGVDTWIVVDGTGHVLRGTVNVRESTHELFTVAVRAALPRWRFAPARHGGQPVRMAQELRVEFRLSSGRWNALNAADTHQVIDTLADGTLRVQVGLPGHGRPAAPLTGAERRTIGTAMLRALVERARGAPGSAGLRIVCLAGHPTPPRDVAADAGLAFLVSPDATLLEALQLPGVAVLHPQRCPPTHSSMVLRVDDQGRPSYPPGEDPTIVSLATMMVETDGRVYADASIARGTGGQWYVCVADRDGANARCAGANGGWVH